MVNGHSVHLSNSLPSTTYFFSLVFGVVKSVLGLGGAWSRMCLLSSIVKSVQKLQSLPANVSGVLLAQLNNLEDLASR